MYRLSMILVNRVESVFGVFLRITLGSIFTYAGFSKLNEPVENLRAILDAYPVIPNGIVSVTALVLPWIEFICGVFLIIGYAPRLSALVLGVLLAGFLAVLGISRFIFGFSPEDCGCFGESGIHLSVPQVLFLDTLSLLIIIKLLSMREHLWSLDHWLGKLGDKE